jgi:shikimate kinase
MHDAQDIAAEQSVLLDALGHRSIVLVGMMGAGKSSIGRKLALTVGLPFIDADSEIEAAAGMSIPDIFDSKGEAYFRAGETRVIARLLDGGPQVLSTGGGAFMTPETRSAIAGKGISIWLKADYEVLLKRIRRRTDRPLLRTANPAQTLRALIDERYPIYAEADITVWSRDVAHEAIVAEILAELAGRLNVAVPDTERLLAGDSAQ